MQDLMPKSISMSCDQTQNTFATIFYIMKRLIVDQEQFRTPILLFPVTEVSTLSFNRWTKT